MSEELQDTLKKCYDLAQRRKLTELNSLFLLSVGFLLCAQLSWVLSEYGAAHSQWLNMIEEKFNLREL